MGDIGVKLEQRRGDGEGYCIGSIRRENAGFVM